MLNKFKALLQDRCPECEQKLLSRHDHLSVTKHCPDEHYREETISQLGVVIVYKTGRPRE